MKKKTSLELVEQSEKVSLYSISFENDRTTEFEEFLQKFEKEASLNEDYQRILYAISKILDHAALERYFRPEGKMSDNLCAIPVQSNRIRLFCLRISNEILILGNGDVGGGWFGAEVSGEKDSDVFHCGRFIGCLAVEGWFSDRKAGRFPAVVPGRNRHQA